MSGNNRKFARNKTLCQGGVSRLVKIAVDLEEASYAVNHINSRARHERDERNAAKKIADAKRKVTLPTTEWLDKFMGR